jgi:hypothetical protein
MVNDPAWTPVFRAIRLSTVCPGPYVYVCGYGEFLSFSFCSRHLMLLCYRNGVAGLN